MSGSIRDRKRVRFSKQPHVCRCRGTWTDPDAEARAAEARGRTGVAGAGGMQARGGAESECEVGRVKVGEVGGVVGRKNVGGE